MKAESKSLFLGAWNRFGDHLELAEIHREASEILKIVHRLDGGNRIRSRQDSVLEMLKEARTRLFVLEHAARTTPTSIASQVDPEDRSAVEVSVQEASPSDDPTRNSLQEASDATGHIGATPWNEAVIDGGLADVNESLREVFQSHTDGDLCEPRDADSSGFTAPSGYPHAIEAVDSVVEEVNSDIQTVPPPPEPWKPDTRTYKAVIELMDLLDKARTDERMGPERMIRNLARKREPLETAFGIDATDSDNQDAAQDVARSLVEWISYAEESPYKEFLDGLQRLLERTCACLGLERIDRRGPFDVADQHILEMVDTDDPGLDQTIEGTVECGYRIGDWVLRPQKVFVYRLAEESDLIHQKGIK